MSDQTLSQQSIKIATEVITRNAEHWELLEFAEYSLRSDFPTGDCPNKCDCPHRDHLDMPYMLEALELDEIELDSEVQHRLAKEFSANPSVSFLKQIEHDYGQFDGELEYMRDSCQSTLDDKFMEQENGSYKFISSEQYAELENTIKECESLLNKLGLD